MFLPVEQAGGSDDYFLAHPPKQPKREIAEYVASHGIKIPPIFADLREALRSGQPVLVRSEHPQDRAGSSGVVDSLLINPQELSTFYLRDSSDWKEFFKRRQPNLKSRLIEATAMQAGSLPQTEVEKRIGGLSFYSINGYCKFNGIGRSDFMKDLSFSYWQALPGINRAVIADSAIKGRHHILSYGQDMRQGFFVLRNHAYYIIENGQVTEGDNYKFPKESDSMYQSVIDFYESVRSLPKFNPNHCPIMEVQTVNKKHYFLQYHRTRDFQAADFVLDRPAGEGEMEAVFVRGVTPSEGMSVTVGVHYDALMPKPEEEGAMDFWPNRQLIEAFVRNRKLQIIDAKDMFSDDPGHRQRSLLFKPQLSIALERDQRDLLKAGINYSEENPQPMFQVEVVSDGRKAYIKRV